MLPYIKESYNFLGFIDDEVKAGSKVDQSVVLGTLAWLAENQTPVELVVAIGNPKVKAKVVQALQKFDHLNYPVLLHERSHIQDPASIKLGGGSIICAGTILTTGISLGEHVLLNLNVTVGHDTRIGNCSSIMPGVNLAGNVELGNEVMVGSGATIINNMKVGNSSIVGAGSVVNHDVPPASTAAGVPARVIR